MVVYTSAGDRLWGAGCRRFHYNMLPVDEYASPIMRPPKSRTPWRAESVRMPRRPRGPLANLLSAELRKALRVVFLALPRGLYLLAKASCSVLNCVGVV